MSKFKNVEHKILELENVFKNFEKIQKWLNCGAKPTEVVSSLLKKAEIISK